MKNRGFINFFPALGLIALALFIDIHLIVNGGAFVEYSHREYLYQKWSGDFWDWAGILMFNISLLTVSVGLFNLWQGNEEVGSVAKTILFGVFAVLGLVFLGIK